MGDPIEMQNYLWLDEMTGTVALRPHGTAEPGKMYPAPDGGALLLWQVRYGLHLYSGEGQRYLRLETRKILPSRPAYVRRRHQPAWLCGTFIQISQRD